MSEAVLSYLDYQKFREYFEHLDFVSAAKLVVTGLQKSCNNPQASASYQEKSIAHLLCLRYFSSAHISYSEFLVLFEVVVKKCAHGELFDTRLKNVNDRLRFQRE